MRAALRILSEISPRHVLDVGCGDGFAGRMIHHALRPTSLTGLDVHLTEKQLLELSEPARGITVVSSEEALLERGYDLLLFLDVIEHVRNDVEFLRHYLETRASPGAHALITAPAFQSLFTSHDTFLRHYRRYRRQDLLKAVERAGMLPLTSGYLFGSLLAPRAAEKARELFFEPPSTHGIGHWKHGPWLSATVRAFLDADNRLLLRAAERGVILPGLSTWALCRLD